VENKVNLQRATKETLERVVTRGCIENEAERILVSTAALLWEFPHSKNGGGLCVRLREQRKDVGLFFPPLVEAIFEWVKEEKESIIEEIQALARRMGSDVAGNTKN
jgi:hypothetical protein